ncbi:XdhC family protein [Eubacteriaceae bacterium ES2]|nr:XdhC family protein [Eubacteriaceae bacterium ES2]
MDKFYEKIGKCEVDKKNLAAKVIDGEHIGEKLVISGSKTGLKSEGSEFLQRQSSFIYQQNETGLIEIEGNRIFCERLRTEKKLVICGAGHVSIPIIQISRMADFFVTVIDDRYSFAQNAVNAGANRVICEPFEQALSKVEGDSNTYFVIVTRGHRYDQICLEEIIKKENTYIGMIGSKVRVKKVKEQLGQKGIDCDKLEKVHTPIGLKIGAETPVEIAISIMAEIVQEKNICRNSSGYSKALLQEICAADLQLPKVLATIVSRKGSAPREVGTKMLVYPDGRTVDSLGGGCAEAEIKMKALTMLSGDTKAELHLVDMTGWQAEEDGMVCGGIIEVFLERL